MRRSSLRGDLYVSSLIYPKWSFRGFFPVKRKTWECKNDQMLKYNVGGLSQELIGTQLWNVLGMMKVYFFGFWFTVTSQIYEEIRFWNLKFAWWGRPGQPFPFRSLFLDFYGERIWKEDLPPAIGRILVKLYCTWFLMLLRQETSHHVLVWFHLKFEPEKMPSIFHVKMRPLRFPDVMWLLSTESLKRDSRPLLHPAPHHPPITLEACPESAALICLVQSGIWYPLAGTSSVFLMERNTAAAAASGWEGVYVVD